MRRHFRSRRIVPSGESWERTRDFQSAPMPAADERLTWHVVGCLK
jgi:hypothetical protein